MLLAAQAGLGVCLLTAAVVAARTYAMLSIANLGPDPRHTVLLSVEPRENVAFSDDQAEEFNRQIVSRLEQMPGTQAIAFASLFPPMTSPVPFTKQGEAADAAREASPATAVSDNYFRTLGIAILFGRGFDRTDRRGGEPVAIISLEMAERNWNTPQDAVGAEIVLGSRARYRIVGVAANFTGYWTRTPLPTIYEPLTQSPSSRGEFIVRTAGPTDAFVALARDALRGTTIPALISDASTMQGRWQATLTRPQARMVCMLLLALLGLGLSIQGAYAVASATVAARRHELAVRSALGARAGRLAWNVTRELVLAAVSGAALGVASAAWLQPVLEQWLGPLAHGTMQPIGFAIVLLALAAATGCYFRRGRRPGESG